MTPRTRPDAPTVTQPALAPRRVVPLAIRLLLLLTLCLAALPFTAHVAGATAYAVTVTKIADSNNGACAATGVAPCSLREAIQFANGKNDGDTVTITLPAGTYNLSNLGAGDENNATGDLDIHRNVILNGAGAATTIIDGQGNLPGSDRVFDIKGNAVVSMSGVTIRNGKIANIGGGILDGSSSMLTLTDCVVKENNASLAGGGIVSYYGPLTLTNTTVSNNTVIGINGINNGDAHGGGISAERPITLTGSSVLTNQATGAGSGSAYGGGIYVNDAATLTASAVQDNTATGGPTVLGSGQGGGIYHKNSPLTLTNSSVIANKAFGGAGGGAAFGGGIAGAGINAALTITGGGVNANLSSATTGYGTLGGGINHDGGALVITDSALNGNSATGDSASGGAISISAASSATITGTAFGGNSATGNGNGAEGGAIISYRSLTVTGSTFNSNSATDGLSYGGGISQRQGNLTVVNSTFSGNSAKIVGGAIYMAASGGTATVTNATIAGNGSGVAQAQGALILQNTIVANSQPVTDNCNGTITDGGYNLDSAVTCGFSGAKGSLSNTNPQLSTFDFYGTSKFKTYVLLPNSPAIDKVPASGANCPAADQLGTARPQGNGCDMGAVEFAPPPPAVTSLTPATGPKAGGTLVSISGFDFLQGATVTIGGQPCLSPSVVSKITITCVTPAGPAGPANVAVTNPGLPPGNMPGTLAGGFTYQPEVTLSKTGSGSVGGNPGSYPFGLTATFTATPDAGNLFLGWTVDGTFVGFNPTLALPMTKDRAVVAAFAPIPAFCDVTPDNPGYEAIINLGARGIVRGQDGCFNPGEPLLRAQSAAMLARAFGWDTEDHGNAFPDQGTVDADLWRNVGTLAFYNVAKGYADGTYDPTGTVLHAQAVSFATRALVAKGYWTQQADDPSLYGNIPPASGHRQDLATYVHYAFAVPGTTDGPWDGPGGWDQPASRSFFARVLWQAYSSYFSTNHIP